MNTKGAFWQKGAASWILPLVIVLLALGGIIFLANKSKPQIANESEILNVKDTDWVRGDRNAKAVLMEYGDFQCPACASYFPLLAEMKQKYPASDFAFIFRHFPLTGHKNAVPASLSAQAAGAQGKFWEMHDKIYGTQEAWSSANNAEQIFSGYAQELGLDMTKYASDYASIETRKAVDTDRLEALKLGVNSTPTFYLNGKKLENNPQSLEAFQTLVEEAIKTGGVTNTATSTPLAYHGHADVVLNLGGKAIDFSKPEFQSTKEKELDEFIHFHNENGKVVHLHQDGKTVSDFLTALKFSLTPMTASPGRFTLTAPDGQKYNEAGDISFQMVVNSEIVSHDSIFSYKIKDLDRIFLRFGTIGADSALVAQASSVSNDACIYSETCPERGPAPEEECVGGLGTTCDE